MPRHEISPTILTKLDCGYRGSVPNVTGLLMLGAALNVPPALLPFPGYPEEKYRCLLGHTAPCKQVVDFLAGRGGLASRPGAENEVGPLNLGIELIRPVERCPGAGTNTPVAQSMSAGTPIRAGILGDTEPQLPQLAAWINGQRREREEEN